MRHDLQMTRPATDVLLIADTHLGPGAADRLISRIADRLAEADVVLHAGDVTDRSVLQALVAAAPNAEVHAVAGNLDHNTVVRQVKKAFAREGFLDGRAEPVSPRQTEKARKVTAGEARTVRPQEQVNLVLGVKGMTRTDPRRFALGVLNTALGGGTSSRMFQEVRELRGLAYSVYSFATHHADAGVVGVSVGCLPGKYDAVLETVRGELAKVAREGITAEELERGKGQLKGGLVLGLEDSGSRMSRLGKAELVYDELLTIDEVLGRIDAVTLDDVTTLARDLFTQPELLAVVGPER